MQTLSTKSQRTRRDVIQAAIDCWSADSSASLGAVADHAGVGRTTVNRHFPTRSALLGAVDQECRERFTAAAGRARLTEGSGLEALLRCCVEIVDLGTVLGLIFADNAPVDPDTWAEGLDPDSAGDGQDAIGTAVARGQADGSIDPTLPLDWVVTWTWTSLFAAWLAIQGETASRHEAAGLLTRTLAGGVRTG